MHGIHYEYGNAIYVMFEDWEELSKRSRLELLRDRNGAAFERIVHRPGWKDALTTIVNDRRRTRGAPVAAGVSLSAV